MITAHLKSFMFSTKILVFVSLQDPHFVLRRKSSRPWVEVSLNSYRLMKKCIFPLSVFAVAKRSSLKTVCKPTPSPVITIYPISYLILKSSGRNRTRNALCFFLFFLPRLETLGFREVLKELQSLKVDFNLVCCMRGALFVVRRRFGGKIACSWRFSHWEQGWVCFVVARTSESVCVVGFYLNQSLKEDDALNKNSSWIPNDQTASIFFFPVF